MIFYCSRCARQVHQRSDSDPAAPGVPPRNLCADCARPAAGAHRRIPETPEALAAGRRKMPRR